MTMFRTRSLDPVLRGVLQLAGAFAAAKLLLQFALTLWTTHIGYGYFRDEFYYIACGRHLAWGYVDHGPIVALQARAGEMLFGDSIFSIRLLSALAESVALFLTGLVTWALGGGRSAQALAMTALFVAPITIAMGGFLSMNSFEPMFWTACALAMVLLVRGHSAARWWAVFSISAGLGLLNKPSMTFFLAAVGVGLLLTPQRRILLTRQAAAGIVLLLLIALPNVLWQVHNHWPTLEFLHNVRLRHKNTELSPLRFLLAQVLMVHPLSAFLWIAGVVALVRGKCIRDQRWLGLAYVIFFAILCTLHAKDYYLAGIYPAFFAAGAVAWESHFGRSRAVQRGSLLGFPVYQIVLVLTGVLILPMASPVLRPRPWVTYTRALHLARTPDETDADSDLPQFYADRFGWQEMSDAVVKTYRSLSPAEQAELCIVGDNYGEAGAVNFLGPMTEPHLPEAISHHNNYWLWGPRGCTGRVVIDIADASDSDLHNYYESVETVAKIDVSHSMPEEHKNIYLLRCRRPAYPITWKKHFD